jgi:HlyD family secretion protein
MDPVDLEDRLLAQRAIIQKLPLSNKTLKSVKILRINKSSVINNFTKINATSQESLAIKQQELDLATATQRDATRTQ